MEDDENIESDNIIWDDTPERPAEWDLYYTKEDMAAAIEAVKSGMSVLDAAAKFAVPSRALQNGIEFASLAAEVKEKSNDGPDKKVDPLTNDSIYRRRERLHRVIRQATNRHATQVRREVAAAIQAIKANVNTLEATINCGLSFGDRPVDKSRINQSLESIRRGFCCTYANLERWTAGPTSRPGMYPSKSERPVQSANAMNSKPLTVNEAVIKLPYTLHPIDMSGSGDRANNEQSLYNRFQSEINQSTDYARQSRAVNEIMCRVPLIKMAKESQRRSREAEFTEEQLEIAMEAALKAVKKSLTTLRVVHKARQGRITKKNCPKKSTCTRTSQNKSNYCSDNSDDDCIIIEPNGNKQVAEKSKSEKSGREETVEGAEGKFEKVPPPAPGPSGVNGCDKKALDSAVEVVKLGMAALPAAYNFNVPYRVLCDELGRLGITNYEPYVKPQLPDWSPSASISTIVSPDDENNVVVVLDEGEEEKIQRELEDLHIHSEVDGREKEKPDEESG